MALKYREDHDLAFLQLSDQEDLEALAWMLTHDSDDKPRYAQELLDDKNFRQNQDELQKAWTSIVAELQKFGGDAIANTVRGYGVLYREILDDVCSRMGIKDKAAKDVAERENQLLKAVMTKYFASASAADIEQFLENAELEATAHQKMTGEEIMALLGKDFRISLLIAQSAAFAVQQAVKGLGAAAAVRYGAAFIPGLNLVMAPLAVTALTGPAYRVTMPAVLQIAYMRRKALADSFKEVAL
jgi:uncharacterized protein YaaW (UPF0174 family)